MPPQIKVYLYTSLERWLANRNILPPLRGYRSKISRCGVIWGSEPISSRSLVCSDFSRSCWIGNGTSLLTPRSKMLVAVWAVAVRMTSSVPGWTLITRPRGHCIEGTLSSLRMTIVSSWMLCPPLLHLLRVISSFRYSLCQRFQKCCLSCWICCHLEGLWNFAHANWLVNRQWGNAGSGGLRKWGLRDRFGSVNIGVNGCKLRIDSISIMSVLNC